MTDAKMSTPVVRKIPFEFPDDIDPHWIPNEPELSAMMNGASLTMPYLEPFLIRTIRECLPEIEAPELQDEISAFAQQEACHYRIHRKFNDLLITKRYADLRHVEADMEKSYEKLGKLSLRRRMAYTAGFEAMTMGVTNWLIGDRVRLFAGADPRVTSFVLWHMVEETEHKRVAYDTYIAMFGRGMGAYFIRMLGVFHGSFDVMRFSRRAYMVMLKRDGLWNTLRSRLRLYHRLLRFMWNVGPFLIRAALPGHNPRSEKDLNWVVDWLDGYEKTAKTHIPLIDTSHPQMPVPFPAIHAEVRP